MRVLLLLILAYIGYRIVKGFLAAKEAPVSKPLKGSEAFQDPVCGIYVSPEDATVGRLEGERIYFCSMDCLEKYQEKLKSTSN